MNIYIALAGLVITVLVQVSGIVWFAATIRAAVGQLTQTTNELRSAVRHIEQTYSGLDRRVTVLEARQDYPRKEIPA